MAQTRFRMDPNPQGMTPSDVTGKDAFTTADKTELNLEVFTTPDETVLCGTWQCAPCREVIAAYPVHEMMTVIAGSVTVTRDGASPETFGPGDTFFIAKGTPVIWEITKTLRKHYLIVA